MNVLQNLLHDALISTNHVEKCALIDFEELICKACSVGYHLDHLDMEHIVDAFENTLLTRERGIFFEDVLYRCYRADNDSIYGKEVISQAKLYIFEKKFYLFKGQ